jgi:hypothetical protein
VRKTLTKNDPVLRPQGTVTGFGIQAVDQKLDKKFDIEASRVWEDGLAATMQSEPWFDAEDFAQVLSVARNRSQETPQILSWPRPDSEK